MKKQIAVIGQGQFGVAVATTTTNMGHDVLAIDINERKIQQVSNQVTHAVQADATSEAVLKELGINNFDIAVISMSSRIETNILATILTKKLGVPYVIARADTELHGSILEKIGADRIVYPEWETGTKLAQGLTLVDVEDYMPLTENYGIIRFKAPPYLLGQKLSELELGYKGKWQIAVFMIQRDEEMIMNPRQAEAIKKGDVLILAGKHDKLENFLAEAKEKEVEKNKE
jgi:trk system potassium uptake protein TrkA